MSLTPLITGLIVAVVMGLVKGIDYLISRYAGKSSKFLSDEQAAQLKFIYAATAAPSRNDTQEGRLQAIEDRFSALEAIRSDNGESQMPRWYVFGQLTEQISDLETKVARLLVQTEEARNLNSLLLKGVSDLVSSQQLVTQRLESLLSKMEGRVD